MREECVDVMPLLLRQFMTDHTTEAGHSVGGKTFERPTF